LPTPEPTCVEYEFQEAFANLYVNKCYDPNTQNVYLGDRLCFASTPPGSHWLEIGPCNY
jgi:hypothetical protein